MAEYTQANRPLRVYTALGDDVLLLNGYHGLEEISQPYGFQLELLSTDPEIDPNDILRTAAHVEVDCPDGSTRVIHGVVNRFTQLQQRDDLTFYRAELVPWLWFLSISRECRIYQNLNVPDILEKVFKQLGFNDFEFRLTREAPVRTYCVQFRETHLHFVSRLMEEEGLYYFFEHTADRHLLVVVDDNRSTPACTGAARARYAPQPVPGEEVVWELEQEHVVYPGTITLRDYDPLKPNNNLQASLSGDGKEEIYDYPGKYVTRQEGDRLARLQLECEEAERQRVRGEGTYRAFVSGAHFTLEEHYRSSANTKYLITQVHHLATTGAYRGWDEGAALDYRNDFTAIPLETPYRPPRRTPRPLIHGSQTAVVVGPAGEEVYVDQYGRVKVQFYWDREGKKNENSSCWVRVATPWGGKNWGAVSIPRIGNEVVVAFEEGDPDRPLIVGSVYNADQMPPFGLPGAGIQMGMKSRSSPGGGGHNEITLTDTKGKELINIHGQYDMVTKVLHDQTNTIDNDRTTGIGHDDSLNVGNNQTIQIGVDRTTKIGSNDDLNVGKNRSAVVAIKDSLKVGAAQDIAVGAAQSTTVGGNQTNKVGGNQSNSVSGKQAITVGKDHSLKIDGDSSTTIAKNETRKVGKKLSIDAGDEITIKTGSASISMKKDGTIVISGKDITIKGSGKMDVKASKNITMKGQKILQN